METHLIQITSGRGPAECCLAVAMCLKELLKEAERLQLKAEIIDRVPADMNGTLYSATIRLRGRNATDFCESWYGPIQWICQSPYRKFHKRKNWFIAVNELEEKVNIELSERDVVFQTMKASGPGGQHVNKTESAVRATHKRSGISVTASASRSQFQNKRDAMELLRQKVDEWNLNQVKKGIQDTWQNHNELQRGDAKRVYEGREFRMIK